MMGVLGFRVYIRMRTQLINGLGHTTWSATVPVSRSQTTLLVKLPFYFSRACCTKAVGIAYKLHRCLTIVIDRHIC